MMTLDAAYSADHFRTLGHVLIDQAANYLASATSGALPHVLPPASPEGVVAAWASDFETPGPDVPRAFESLFQRVLDGSNHLHHPKYVGHQVTAPLPVAALADLVASILNNGMAVFEMGPISTAMERHVVRFLAGRIGYTDGADGVLTSGGSAGNLTALLAARQAQAGFDVWTHGVSAGPKLAVVCSDQSHYCIKRAAQIMGLGSDGVRIVPSDDAFRMRVDGLREVLAAAKADGVRVIAVVASACSTATGAIDPLDAIADVCDEHGVWLHIDGAHGAALALSDATRPLLRGIERADSVVWDAHKMMLVPALVTAVLFRESRRSYAAFAQEASYLFAGDDPAAEWFNLATRTLECTKTMMSLKLYLALRLYGRPFFAEYVERMRALARRFERTLAARDGFESLVTPDFNIVCFRHLPRAPAGGNTPEALDAHQERVRERLLASGAFYLVKTRVRARLYLRATLINPLTTDADLDALLDTISGHS